MGNSRWCPELESRTTQYRRRSPVQSRVGPIPKITARPLAHSQTSNYSISSLPLFFVVHLSLLASLFSRNSSSPTHSCPTALVGLSPLSVFLLMRVAELGRTKFGVNSAVQPMNASTCGGDNDTGPTVRAGQRTLAITMIRRPRPAVYAGSVTAPPRVGANGGATCELIGSAAAASVAAPR